MQTRGVFVRAFCVALVVGPLACSLGPVIDVPFQEPDRGPSEGADGDGGLVTGDDLSDGGLGAGGPVAAGSGGGPSGGGSGVGGDPIPGGGGGESLGGAAGAAQAP